MPADGAAAPGQRAGHGRDLSTEVGSDAAYYRAIMGALAEPRAPFPTAFPAPVREMEMAQHPVLAGLLSSFDLPLADLWEPSAEAPWEALLDEFSLDLGVGFGLDPAGSGRPGGAGQGALGGHNLRLSSTLGWNPLSYWFARFTGYYYPDRDQQAPWDPDFSYAFGYDDWHPYTLSLVYANYQGNRFNPARQRGERITPFREGTWTLAWKFPLPDPLRRWVVVDEIAGVGWNVGYALSPRYFDNTSIQDRRHKHRLFLGCRYQITGNWYIGATAYYYPQAGQQQPWDPDYVYGFGYFDWRPGTLSVEYNNYSGNRFPGRERAENTGRFRDGSISVTWKVTF